VLLSNDTPDLSAVKRAIIGVPGKVSTLTLRKDLASKSCVRSSVIAGPVSRTYDDALLGIGLICVYRLQYSP
jgi:hypothetical protein